MLSDRLVRMIEDHADELTCALVYNLQTNPRTGAYHRLPREAIHERTYNVYKNLSVWLSNKSDEGVEAIYTALGKERAAEGSPLSEVVYALILTKYHLRDYIQFAGIVDSAVELYQQHELHRLLDGFFDKLIYYTVRGYERQQAAQSAPLSAKRAG